MKNKFVVGQKAYVLRMHIGRNVEPEIVECTVEKIGRKYIYVSGAGYDVQFLAIAPYKSHLDFSTLLCSSKEEANRYIECHKMRIQLRHMDFSDLSYHALHTICSLCQEKEEMQQVIVEGDVVYVSNPDFAYEEEQLRSHRNFFGKVTEIGADYVVVNFGNNEEWAYSVEELSLAKELRHMTLEDFSNTFGVCVNATFLLNKNQ